jgi:hypothetical protein
MTDLWKLIITENPDIEIGNHRYLGIFWSSAQNVLMLGFVPAGRKEYTMKRKTKTGIQTDKFCFVISPIGQKGTKEHKRFLEVYDYIIKPAVENSGYDLKIIRPDEIDRSGSFIKDILDNLSNSYIVIADLTGRNPNVFYELGVRHSLSPRTILVAQSVDDIPSDLREYRSIIYENSAKGSKEFKDRLSNYLKEIFDEPNRSDNPVLDRLGSIIETKTHLLEEELSLLKEELNNILRKGMKGKSTQKEENVFTRMARIFELRNADKQASLSDGQVIFEEKGKEKTVYLRKQQGDFNLYFVMRPDGNIDEYWYVSMISGVVNLGKQLSDIRVLMNKCLDKLEIEQFKFIIATNEDLSKEKQSTQKAFNKILTFIPAKHRSRFVLELWDSKGLLEQEKALGLKVDI